MTTWDAIKTVFVLVGLPCSGKTTVAQRLRQETDEILERDAFLERIGKDVQIMEELSRKASTISQPCSRAFPTPIQNALNDVLTQEYNRHITACINSSSSKRYIVDGTHLHPLSRAFIRGLRNTRAIALVLDTDPTECIRRLKHIPARTGIRQTLTPKIIQRLAKFAEPPTCSEGFSQIVHLDPTKREDLQSRLDLG